MLSGHSSGTFLRCLNSSLAERCVSGVVQYRPNKTNLIMFWMSAPEKPGVARASKATSTPGSFTTFFMWCFKICALPLTSGSGTTTRRSKRPGRINALYIRKTSKNAIKMPYLSKLCAKLVAPITITPSRSNVRQGHAQYEPPNQFVWSRLAPPEVD